MFGKMANVLLLAFVAFDLLAGVYLLVYALRREQRDKPGVAIAGAMLLLAAVALVIISLLQRPPPARPQEPIPSVTPSTVGANTASDGS